MDQNQEGSGPDEGPNPSQRQQVLELLRSSPGLTDLEVSERLGIPLSSAGTRLTELYDRGEIEPFRGQGPRQRWRPVPPERQDEVKKAALNRTRKRLLKTFTRQPLAIQGWLWRQGMAKTIDSELERKLLEETCPEEDGTGHCTCRVLNVWVSRHDRDKKDRGKSRTRRVADEWRRERRAIREEMERARREDPVAVQYLTYKGYLRDAMYKIAHMAGFVEEEIGILKERGYGDLPVVKWQDIRDLAVDVGSALTELQNVLGILLDDEGDWIEGEEVDDIEDAVLELDP